MKSCLRDPRDLFGRLHDRPRRWCCDNDVIADVSNVNINNSVGSPDQMCCGCMTVSHQNDIQKSLNDGHLRPQIGFGKNSCNVQHLNYGHYGQNPQSGEIEFLHADFNTLNTKSSFLGEEDDYFLSLSKDRRFLTPIPVSEL